MNITKTSLLKAMKACSPGVDAGHAIIEGTDTFVFSGRKIHSYNDHISVTVPVEVDEDINGVVKSKDFYALVSKFKEDEITIREKDGKWRFKNGKTRGSMTLLEDAISQYIKDLNLDKLDWKEIPEGFFTGLSLCFISANHSPHAGIYIREKLMVSTDLRRLNYYDLPEEMETFYLTDASARELMKFDGLNRYCAAEGWIHFSTADGVVFSARSKDLETYPYDGVVKKRGMAKTDKGDLQGSLPAGISEALDRVSTLSRVFNEGDTEGVRITFNKESLELYSERETGTVAEEVKLDKAFKEDVNLTIWVDAHFLKEAVKKSMGFFIKKMGTKNAENQVVETPVLVFSATNYAQIVATIVPE